MSHIVVHYLLKNLELVDHAIFSHLALTHLVFRNYFNRTSQTERFVCSLHNLAVAAFSDNLAKHVDIVDVFDSLE